MGRRLFALFRAVVVGSLFVSIWTWFIPRWIAFEKHVPFETAPNPGALALTAIGGVIILRCVWDFAWRGFGTPAPFDAPRHLVVTGLYRWVRNPMYIGLGVFLIGEALLVPGIEREMLVMVPILWAVVTLFVMLYEEPTLRRRFGAEYEDYCRNVRRWIPRLRPFDKVHSAA